MDLPQAGQACTACGTVTPRVLLHETAGVCPACFVSTNPPKQGKAQQTAVALEAAEKAAKVVAQKELARRHLLSFVETFNPGYQAGWVHKDLCARLENFAEAVERGESPRLLVMFPPRHGKSTIASEALPAWYLGNNPTHEFILCSYGTDLAASFSRKTRAIMRDPAYHELFPDTELDPGSQSVQFWHTTKGGGLLAAGVGRGITGHGAHILVIDDPVKDRQEADSYHQRDLTWSWYSSTAYTRLAPGGGVLVIQTRWHDDDLSGRLLAAMEPNEIGETGDQWEVIKYPAIAPHDEEFRKQGEALHTDRYNMDALQQIKRNMTPRDWSALYQQEPVSDEGAYFSLDMIQYYDPERFDRKHWHYYAAWDLAIGEKEVSDYTVGITVGLAPDNNIYIVEEVRGHWQSKEIVKNILDSHKKWRPKIIGIEKGHIEMAIGPYLREEIKRRKLYSANMQELAAGRRDKEARGRSIQGRMENQMVFFPRQAPWAADMIAELLRFPSGKHDDRVDALSWIGLMLDDFVPARELVRVKKLGWRDELMKSIRNEKHRSAMSA